MSIGYKFNVRKVFKRLLILLIIILLASTIYNVVSIRNLHFATKTLRKSDSVTPDFDALVVIDNLTRIIRNLNSKCEIYNVERYGFMTVDTTTVVIQVHAEVARLNYLIESLSRVGNIDEILVIFSHSFYDDQINHLIRNIYFCRVLQIFYPHSPQLHPGKFPGVEIDDCVGGVEEVFCVQRDAFRAIHKHHWWWKARWVFERLPWSKSYEGFILFLEENDYVAPDGVYVLEYLQDMAIYYFSDVELVSLGGPLIKRDDYVTAAVKKHWAAVYERGIAFNRTTWNQISKLQQDYCYFDDFSWSYSLTHAFDESRTGRPTMLGLTVPRVLVINETNVRYRIEIFDDISTKAGFFPQDIKVLSLVDDSTVRQEMKKLSEGRGGWSDPRDVSLCLELVGPTVAATLAPATRPSTVSLNTTDEYEVR